MAVLDELFVKLGYDVDQETVDTFNAGVQTTIRGFKRVAIGGIAAATAVVFFVKKMTGFQNAQKQIADNLDLPVQLTQAWQDAAEDMGVSGQIAVSALTKVRRVQEDLAVGKPPSPDFLRGLAAINLVAADLQGLSASDALVKISSGLSKLDGATKGGVASLLNLREELNFVGNPATVAAIAENFNDADFTGLDDLTTKWANFTQAGRKAAQSFAEELAPTIGGGLDFLSETIDGLRENFGGFLKAIADDEINPIDDAAEKLDNFVFGAWRKAFGQLLDSEIVQNTGQLINDTLGTSLPVNTPESIGGLRGRTGAGVSAGALAGAGGTVTNNYKFDIVSDNPEKAGQAVRRVLESENRKAVGNFQSTVKN